MVEPRIALRQIEAGLDPNARLLPRYCFVFVLFLWTPKEVDWKALCILETSV